MNTRSKVFYCFSLIWWWSIIFVTISPTHMIIISSCWYCEDTLTSGNHQSVWLMRITMSHQKNFILTSCWLYELYFWHFWADVVFSINSVVWKVVNKQCWLTILFEGMKTGEASLGTMKVQKYFVTTLSFRLLLIPQPDYQTVMQWWPEVTTM